MQPWPVVTHVVVLGGADGGFESVQMGLDVLHVHRVLAATHFQHQLLRKHSRAESPAPNFGSYFSEAQNLRLLLTLALRPMMS